MNISISIKEYILRLAMFLEFAISPFNMPNNSKMSIVGHPKSLPGFPKRLPGFPKSPPVLSKSLPGFPTSIMKVYPVS